MNDVDPKGRRRDTVQDIEREIRDWTGRPPARSPRMARQRVLARIEERRPMRGWLAVAAATAVAVALTLGLLLRGPGTPQESPVVIADSSTSSPGESQGTGLLVYELESGTHLYMSLAVTAAFTKTNMEGS